jgi:hypothetical protein
MVEGESGRQEAPPAEAKPDPFAGVPPGCSPPRPMWPLWLGLIGFILWVLILLVLMVIRFRTSVV